MDDIKEIITCTLDQKGVLSRIKAELRANIFMAVDEQDKRLDPNGAGGIGARSDARRREALARTQDGALLVDLVHEFLQWADLRFTSKVFDAEIGCEGAPPHRRRLAEELGMAGVDEAQERPLLMWVLLHILAQAKLARAFPPIEPEASAAAASDITASDGEVDPVTGLTQRARRLAPAPFLGGAALQQQRPTTAGSISAMGDLIRLISTGTVTTIGGEDSRLGALRPASASPDAAPALEPSQEQRPAALQQLQPVEELAQGQRWEREPAAAIAPVQQRPYAQMQQQQQQQQGLPAVSSSQLAPPTDGDGWSDEERESGSPRSSEDIVPLLPGLNAAPPVDDEDPSDNYGGGRQEEEEDEEEQEGERYPGSGSPQHSVGDTVLAYPQPSGATQRLASESPSSGDAATVAVTPPRAAAYAVGGAAGSPAASVSPSASDSVTSPAWAARLTQMRPLGGKLPPLAGAKSPARGADADNSCGARVAPVPAASPASPPGNGGSAASSPARQEQQSKPQAQAAPQMQQLPARPVWAAPSPVSPAAAGASGSGDEESLEELPELLPTEYTIPGGDESLSQLFGQLPASPHGGGVGGSGGAWATAAGGGARAGQFGGGLDVESDDSEL